MFDLRKNICEGIYGESCIKNCIQWILEAKIISNNKEIKSVIIYLFLIF